jgi:hypothetical protein
LNLALHLKSVILQFSFLLANLTFNFFFTECFGDFWDNIHYQSINRYSRGLCRLEPTKDVIEVCDTSFHVTEFNYRLSTRPCSYGTPGLPLPCEGTNLLVLDRAFQRGRLIRCNSPRAKALQGGPESSLRCDGSKEFLACLIGGTVTAEVLSSPKQTGKEERTGSKKASRSQNKPYTFRIKFVAGANRTRDLALTRRAILKAN